jgi:hypothetical protein
MPDGGGVVITEAGFPLNRPFNRGSREDRELSRDGGGGGPLLKLLVVLNDLTDDAIDFNEFERSGLRSQFVIACTSLLDLFCAFA